MNMYIEFLMYTSAFAASSPRVLWPPTQVSIAERLRENLRCARDAREKLLENSSSFFSWIFTVDPIGCKLRSSLTQLAYKLRKSLLKVFLWKKIDGKFFITKFGFSWQAKGEKKLIARVGPSDAKEFYCHRERLEAKLNFILDGNSRKFKELDKANWFFLTPHESCWFLFYAIAVCASRL